MNQAPPTIQRKTTPVSGFSLLEVLTVIGIIVILAAVLFPSARKAIEKSQSAQCGANLRTLHAGIMAYAADHNMEVPSSYDDPSTAIHWPSVLAPGAGKDGYVPHPGFGIKKAPFFCPTNPVKIEPRGTQGWSNYAINGNLFEPNSTRPKPLRFNQVSGGRVMLIDSYNANKKSTYLANNGARYSNPWTESWPVHGERLNVIFVDGHMESPNVMPHTTSQTDLNELKAAWFWPL